MSEPLNDKEFEAVKRHPMIKDIDRLIATVEKWNGEAFTYQSKAVRAMERVLEYKEENARLKEQMESLKRINVIGLCEDCSFMELQMQPSAGKHYKEWEVCINEKSYCYGITVKDGCIHWDQKEEL